MSTPNILAADHRGMKANGIRLLRQNQGQGFGFMRGQMANHLEEVARRYYAGDITAVDEFLQLYSIGKEQREKAKQAAVPPV